MGDAETLYLFFGRVAGDLQIGIEDALITALSVGVQKFQVFEVNVQTAVHAIEDIVHIFVVAFERFQLKCLL